MSFFGLPQGIAKATDSEMLEYSVHAGVQTTLQVLCPHILQVSGSPFNSYTQSVFV